ncbi:CSG1/SUR1-like protein [Elasticomyces elasticus]|nr:CSG1/SUR1-like protein [Elasticomyces elasticus]KAK5731946.1 CSG1/SUR1-like protein [Elasticomyces elasticus]
MRRGLLISLLVTLAILGFFLNQVWTLLSILVVRVTGDAILRSELPASGSPREEGKKQITPKIIHQTYKTTATPPVWQEVQVGCIALHPESEGWEYKLWADEMGLEFIQREYERFYETYAGYEYPIQRADAIRYFVLRITENLHRSGRWMQSVARAAACLPSFVRRTIPTGISNDVMGAVPGHPFCASVRENQEL